MTHINNSWSKICKIAYTIGALLHQDGPTGHGDGPVWEVQRQLQAAWGRVPRGHREAFHAGPKTLFSGEKWWTGEEIYNGKHFNFYHSHKKLTCVKYAWFLKNCVCDFFLYILRKIPKIISIRFFTYLLSSTYLHLKYICLIV